MPTEVGDGVDAKRVGIFLAVTFAVSWTAGGVVYLLGGGTLGGLNPIVQLLLVSGVFMFGPAVGHVVARTATGEGWDLDDTWIRPRIRSGWKYWVVAWIAPPVLSVLGAALFFLAFPATFDAGMPVLEQSLENVAGVPPWMTPEVVFLVTVAFGLTLAVPFNAVFTFGEEFGWRAYLLQHLLPLGPRKAVVVLGVVWGVWHWPLTVAGHNYGLDHAFAPVGGMLAMLWFTTVVGVFLAWVTLRGGSVWPAVIGHASLNALAGVGIYFATNDPSTLLGPAPTGIVGSIPFTLVAVWVLLDETRLRPDVAGETSDDPDEGAPTPAATVDSSGASGSAAAVPERDSGDG